MLLKELVIIGLTMAEPSGLNRLASYLSDLTGMTSPFFYEDTTQYIHGKEGVSGLQKNGTYKAVEDRNVDGELVGYVVGHGNRVPKDWTGSAEEVSVMGVSRTKAAIKEAERFIGPKWDSLKHDQKMVLSTMAHNLGGNKFNRKKFPSLRKELVSINPDPDVVSKEAHYTGIGSERMADQMKRLSEAYR